MLRRRMMMAGMGESEMGNWELLGSVHFTEDTEEGTTLGISGDFSAYKKFRVIASGIRATANQSNVAINGLTSSLYTISQAAKYKYSAMDVVIQMDNVIGAVTCEGYICGATWGQYDPFAGDLTGYGRHANNNQTCLEAMKSVNSIEIYTYQAPWLAGTKAEFYGMK